jgi:inorganic pyrophosphatase
MGRVGSIDGIDGIGSIDGIDESGTDIKVICDRDLFFSRVRGRAKVEGK